MSIAVAVRAVQAATLRIVNQTGGPPELARPGSPPRLAARFVHQGCKIVAITFRQHERTIATVDGIVAHLARDGAVPEAT